MTRALTIVWIVAATTAMSGVAIGTPAPSLRLPDADGRPLGLDDFKGHVVLVDFWASWCVPCAHSFPALDSLYRELHPRGFDVLAVNLDERRSDADRFLAAHPHALTVVFDPHGASARAYDIQGMPSSVVVDRGGRIRFTHMGYSDKVIDTYRQEISLLLSERQP